MKQNNAMPWADAITKVLGAAKDPLHYSEITEEIAARQLRSALGATPAATVSSVLSESLKKNGVDSPFERVSRGVYRLRPKPGNQRTLAVEEEEDDAKSRIIQAFGMFWRADKVHWASSQTKLLGRQTPHSTEVDFRDQRGVYLPHDGARVLYVGKANEQGLGSRLAQHRGDRLGGRCDRFSWFGISEISSEGKVHSPKDTLGAITASALVNTLESLLIEGLEPPQNRQRGGDDFGATEYLQVEDPKIRNKQAKELLAELTERVS